MKYPICSQRAYTGSMRTYKSQNGFSAVTIVVLLSALAAAGFFGWYVARANSDVARTTEKSAVAVNDKESSRQPVATASGKGGFSIVLPDGWNNVIRDKNSDLFVVAGTNQPEFGTGRRAMVVDSEGYGSDSALVFSAQIYDNFAPAMGEATDFLFGKGDDLLSGKKYVYEFDKDELEGIGYQRIKGDRNYTYVFPLGGSNGKRELRVTYSVYASDPRNNIDKIDEVVRSIRVLK